MAICRTFGSRSVLAHLTRGALAAVLLAAGFGGAADRPAVVIACVVGAVIVMRGCPMCWTIGLVETIMTEWRRR